MSIYRDAISSGGVPDRDNVTGRLNTPSIMERGCGERPGTIGGLGKGKFYTISTEVQYSRSATPVLCVLDPHLSSAP